MENREMEILIDCAGIENRRQMHDLLREKLSLPMWYGGNLDALYDCLTAVTDQTHLVFRNFPESARNFRRVLTDASVHNPLLTIEFA